MVRVAQPSGGETTFEKDLPRSPRCIRVSQPSGGKTTFDKELPKSPRTVRVLKPPGGGSSISFGGDDVPSKTASPAPHDSSKSNGIQNGNSHTNGHAPTTNGTCNGTMSNGSMTPNGSSTTASSPGSAKSGDTQNRLFGESNHTTTRDRDSTPTKPTIKSAPKVRDHMRSSIFGEDSNGSGTPSRNGTPNGTAYYGSWRRRDPVTGEGVQCWDLHAPRHGSFHRRGRGNTGRGTPSISEVGSVKETPEPPKPASAPAAQQPRGRVPPGGHSTALW